MESHPEAEDDDSASCVADHEEEKEDLETRMQALKAEMRDLDLEHEREREELASGTCSSGPDAADVAREAARSDTNDAVVQERIDSVRTAIDDLRDRSSQLGLSDIGLEQAAGSSLAIGAGSGPPDDNIIKNEGKNPGSVLAEGKNATISASLSAESSYLRYTVNLNATNMTRHHPEVLFQDISKNVMKLLLQMKRACCDTFGVRIGGKSPEQRKFAFYFGGATFLQRLDAAWPRVGV